MPPYLNPNNHVLHIPANLVRLCYYCSLLSHWLVCMLGCYQLLPPWFGISLYYIVVDDMIIRMLTISTKDGRSRLSRPDALFHSSHLGPEFRVLCLLTSVPNRVWDAMGSPFLNYLASNISSGGPS